VGSDEPTPFSTPTASETGHDVQIFLLGEAVNLMRSETMNAVTPVGWPPLAEIIANTIQHKSPISV
jgi:predicted peroxiredoxin